MITLIATKRFLRSGTMVEKNETFKVNNENTAREFISRDLAKKKETAKDTTETEGAANYEDMTVNELREIARRKEVEGAISRMTKPELIEAIKEAE